MGKNDMAWLQCRLDELGMSHEDLKASLDRLGIHKSRPTITNWANGKPIPLLMSGEETALLAQALQWSTNELLIAAGYKIQNNELNLPPEILRILTRIGKLPRKKLILALNTLLFGVSVFEDYPENELPDEKLDLA